VSSTILTCNQTKQQVLLKRAKLADELRQTTVCPIGGKRMGKLIQRRQTSVSEFVIIKTCHQKFRQEISKSYLPKKKRIYYYRDKPQFVLLNDNKRVSL